MENIGGNNMKKMFVLLLCTFMCVLISGCGGNDPDKKEETKKVEPAEIEWPEDGISKVLPKPKAKRGEIGVNFDDVFSEHIKISSKDDFDKYVKECKNKGFTIEAEEKSDDYVAFNNEGYKLHLYYYDSNKSYDIDLNAPIKIGTLNWPKSGTATLLPTPESDKGNITDDSSNCFMAYVGDTTVADLKSYANECKKLGFDVNYNNGDDFYYADNKKGDSLHISYNGFNIMFVRLDLANDDTSNIENNDKSNKPASSDKDSSKKDIADFKKAMDSYETLVNDYVSFMKKYSESSNPSDMIDEYTDYMNKYADTMQKLNSLNQEELSEEELLYYTKTMARISKKLLEVQ